ncbi:MAG: integrase [Betaproteobacteria bacterium RBG_19FT_COMBO_58_11]|nr:MAG: integrase [Betaproteobacteria bacterium RBG_19FT_COMBO_58_11]
MNTITSLHATPKTWLLNSVLAPYAETFAARLERGRYAANTTTRYLGSIAHLARWMTQCGLSVRRLDERAVEQFLAKHLPRCDCPTPVVRVYRDLRAACHHLIDMLREQGIIAEPTSPSDPVAGELRRYDKHMRDVRGLSAGTRSGRLRIVQRLLLRKFADGPVMIAKLRSDDVRQFIADQLELRGTTSNAATLSSALRAYFHYRAICGDRVDGLTGAISSPAHWSLASLPRALSDADVDRLLASFTPELPSPKRGYAIVRCALDMGLRCSEIAKLTLADIDWRTGTVTLKRTKSRRQDILPLLASTGRALADYLRHERPTTSNPAVFVRRLAPRDQPIGVDAIRRVVLDAYRRIGLTHSRTHALRHTMARRLLEHGSSLKEVADVLRHRSLNTSLIYAKLDNPRLVAVALPWPGSSS